MHDANEALEMNSPDIIKREREFERLHKELEKQFRLVDVNNDGSISKNELVNYLKNLIVKKDNTALD